MTLSNESNVIKPEISVKMFSLWCILDKTCWREWQWYMEKKYYVILPRLHFDRWVGTIWTTLFPTRFTDTCFSNCPFSSKVSEEKSKNHFTMHWRLFWKAASTLGRWNSAFYCPSSQTGLQHRCHSEERSIWM